MQSAKICTSFLIFLLFFFIFKTPVFAEKIAINEFSSSAGTSSHPDWPDWVEVYYESVDPVLYQLKDAKDNVKNLSDGTCSDNFCTLDWSNKLDNSGDTISLILISNPDSVIDQVEYPKDVPTPTTGQYAGRNSDGMGAWVLFSSHTKGLSNNTATLAPTSTPTPTPSPTNTPTPTKAPTPTKTPTPTKSPTPTKAPSPTEAPTPIKSSLTAPTGVPSQSPKKILAADSKIVPTSILGVSTMNPLNTPTGYLEGDALFPTKKPVKVLGSSENNLGMILIIIGIIFLISCGILAFRTYRKNFHSDDTYH
jgi:hypothetical protein